jgi:hypothetical protein
VIRKSLSLVASVGLATLLYGASPASAQAVAPSLGTAAPYAVLGTNAIPTAGTVTCTTSIINGNVGTTAASITNTGPCTISGSIDKPVLGSVVTDFNAAFAAIDTLNPVCGGVIPIGGGTLAPGCYSSAAGTTLGAVTLTLNGSASDVWVFRIGTGGGGTLTLTNTQVVMGGTALPCNVYWKTSADATLTDSIFNGTVLSGAAVTMTNTGPGASWFGRALATTDVTLTSAAPLTFAGCSPPTRPTVAKAFSPVSIAAGGVSTLTITLNNPNAAGINLNALFTDTLPGGVLVAAVPNLTTTCGGGPAGAVAGGTTVTLATLSTIPASGSCTIKVDVTAAAAGSYTNTISAGALKTNTGTNLNPATASLAVTLLPPTVAKAFSPSTNGPGGISTLTITLTNANGTAATLTAPLVDTLPAGVVLAASPNASTTCGGTVTAAAGGSSITLSQAGSAIPASGSCTVIANVTSATAGTYTNTIGIGALSTSAGLNTVAASAVLTISAAVPPVPTLSRWSMIVLGGLLCLGGFFAIRRRRLTN